MPNSPLAPRPQSNPNSLTDLEASLLELFSWLEKTGLTRTASGYNAQPDDKLLSPDHRTVLGLPCSRAQKNAKEQLEKIKDAYSKDFSKSFQAGSPNFETIWNEIRNPRAAIRDLDIDRIPADAIAFYRPFHFPPTEEWGIYIHIPRLLEYGKSLQNSLGRLKSFTAETLTLAVLFDVFHHEFFHHLVESTATVLEVICASNFSPEPIYLNYRMHSYERNQGCHVHKPVEEALANAYAYNSFSFISRVKVGYKNRFVKLYQSALEKSWPREPAGYKEAENYIKGGQITGATDLLSMFLCTDKNRNRLPLAALAQFVFPGGHTAFCSKPEIPTYLIGTVEELRAFHKLVPAPNEAYSNLFWPGDTSALDAYIKQHTEQERHEKKRRAQGRIKFLR